MEKRWYSLTLPVLLMLAIALFGFGCDDNGIVPIADGDQTVEDGDDTVDGDDVSVPEKGAPCEVNEDCGDSQVCVDKVCKVTCMTRSECLSTEICSDGICIGNCNNSCIPADGFYCDYEEQVCKMVDCTPCTEARSVFYCGSDGAVCSSSAGSYNSASYCLPKAVDGACPDGYDNAAGTCKPKARCKGMVEAEAELTTEKVASVPGGPCELAGMFKGHSCAKGASCVGSVYDEDMDDPRMIFPCTTREDCRDMADTFSDLTFDQVDCSSSGYCGIGFCVSPCSADGSCPVFEGLDIDIYPGTVSGSCYCGPTPFFKKSGNAKVGDVCNTQSDDDLPLCLPDLDCLGFTKVKECTSNSECTEFGSNAFCNYKNVCSVSYCASYCEDDKCPDGQNFVQNQDACMCTLDTLLPTGSAEADAVCDGGAKESFDECKAGLHCRVDSDGYSTQCTQDSDCGAVEWGPNAFCSDLGYCSFSVCGTPCTAGACPEGMKRLKDSPETICVCTGIEQYGEEEVTE